MGTGIGLWVGVQLGLAGPLVLVGGAAAFGQALDEAASWWMVYMALVDLGTLDVIFWLLGRDGGSYRGCWARRQRLAGRAGRSASRAVSTSTP